jgi:hypothetical protein
LITHTDGTTRSGREKFSRLRQWSDKMRTDPLYWPQFVKRDRPVGVLVKKIVDESPRPLTRFEVERKFRKFRKVPSTGLAQEMKELANTVRSIALLTGFTGGKGPRLRLTSHMLSVRTS